MDRLLKQSLHQMRILILSSMIAVLGIAIYSFGMSFYILSSTGSAKLFSINLAVGIFGRILSTPVSGFLADHYNRKKVLFFCMISEAFIVFGLLLFIHTFGFHIIALYATTFLAAFVSSLSNPSLMAAIPSIVHADHMQKTMGYNSTASSLSMLLGPVIGGILYGFVSKELFLILFVVAYFISALLILLLNFNLFKNETSINHDKENVLQSFVTGLKYILQHRVIRSLLLLFMTLNFFLSSLNIGMSKIIVGHFKASSQMMGILEASFSVGVLIGGIIIGIQKKINNPFPILKWGLIFDGFAMMMISLPFFIFYQLWPVYMTFLVMGLLLGINVQYINTPLFVFFQEKIEEHIRGRVFAVISLISQLLMPISYIIFGFIFDLGYYGLIYLICGIICIAITLMVMNKQFYQAVEKIYRMY